jgi:hypothetical protein
MKWKLTVLESSFPMFGLNTLASAGQPHTRKWISEGSLPVHNSYGVLGTDVEESPNLMPSQEYSSSLRH